MTYGDECWTLKKKDEVLMNKTEIRSNVAVDTMCYPQRDHVQNEEIRKSAKTTHLMQK